jgi:acetate kinase
MSDRVLVVNSGSSSVKYQLLAVGSGQRLARGLIERVGEAGSDVPDHDAAVHRVVDELRSAGHDIGGEGVDAVGHRVVHGGERFTHSVLITDEVLRGIEDCIDLAPLHNPANVRGIVAAREVFGTGLQQVAVFDTAFHQTLPDYAYLYALPYQFYRRHRVRRYGFHGTSHRYVAYRYRTLRNLAREQTNIITLHLGNGCSVAAIMHGDSVDTSMGLTPLEGLVMGTRSGDIDPAIIDFIAAKEGLNAQQVETMLNKQSGLIGISGLTNDMRELLAEAHENDDRRARLAIEIFCYRARKYIGAYLAALGGADAIVFTGGIGENAPEIRARISTGLQWFGLELDEERNAAHTAGREGLITRDDARLAAYVIPTDEELLIARDTVRVVMGAPQRY